MKNILLASVLSLLAVPALAKDVYVSRDMTCSELQSALQNDGSLTLQTRFGQNTYFASASACNAFQEANPSYEAAQDKTFCFVGYTCVNEPNR